MKGMKNVIIIILVNLFVFFSLKAAVANTFNVEPNKIEIKFFYHGDTLKIKGSGNWKDKDYIINILSDNNEKSSFKLIKKIGGLIWMKTDDVHIQNVPYFYHIYSTKPLDKILNEEDIDKYNLSFSVLGKKAIISSAKSPLEKESLWREYLKYKLKQKLYQEGRVYPKQIQEEKEEKFEIDIPWPYQAFPGIYKIRILEVKNGEIINAEENKIEVQKVGFVKFLSDFAQRHAFVYGVFAVLIAIISGFLVNSVFNTIFKKGVVVEKEEEAESVKVVKPVPSMEKGGGK